MEAHPPEQRKQVHGRMVEGMLELEELKAMLDRINDKQTALVQFDDAIVKRAKTLLVDIVIF